MASKGSNPVRIAASQLANLAPQAMRAHRQHRRYCRAVLTACMRHAQGVY